LSGQLKNFKVIFLSSTL